MGIGIDQFRQIAEKLYEQLHDASNGYSSQWLDNMLFSWRWWLGTAMLIGFWVAWFILRKKEITLRLFAAGAFAWIVASFLDMVGISLGLWYYPVNLFPMMPCLVMFDYSILPVVTMLFIQYCRKVNPVYKAIVYSLLGSFFFQPLMEWAGFVVHAKWPDYYSVPFLFLIYLGADWLSKRPGCEPLTKAGV